MIVYLVLRKHTLEYCGTFSTKDKAQDAIDRLGWHNCAIHTIVVDHYVNEG